MNWNLQAPTRSQVKTGLPGISLVSEPFADVVLRPVIRAVHLASEGLRFRFVCMAKVLLRLLLFLHTGYWLSLFLCQTLRIHTCLDVLMYLIRTISHFIKHLQIHSIFSLIYRTSWLVSDGANLKFTIETPETIKSHLTALTFLRACEAKAFLSTVPMPWVFLWSPTFTAPFRAMFTGFFPILRDP